MNRRAGVERLLSLRLRRGWMLLALVFGLLWYSGWGQNPVLPGDHPDPSHHPGGAHLLDCQHVR